MTHWEFISARKQVHRDRKAMTYVTGANHTGAVDDGAISDDDGGAVSFE